MTKNEILKESVVDTLLDHGWVANNRYNGRLNNRGQFTGSDGAVMTYLKDNYLISSSGRYAVTVKDLVFTLHDSKRNYAKILSMKLSQIEILDTGIKCGCLLLMYDDESCTTNI